MLSLAIRTGNRKFISHFLSSISDSDIRLALQYPKALKVLLDQGITFSEYLISSFPYPESLKLMLDFGVRNPQALVQAIILEEFEATKILLQYEQPTPYHLNQAIWYKNLEMIKLLLNHGVPIQEAKIGSGNLQIAQYLLSRGYEPTTQDVEEIYNLYIRYDSYYITDDISQWEFYQILEFLFTHPKILIQYHADLRFSDIVQQILQELGISHLQLNWDDNLQMRALTSLMKILII